MSQNERDFDQVRREATDEWLNLGKGSRLILDLFYDKENNLNY